MPIVDGLRNVFPQDTVNDDGDTVQIWITQEDTLAGGITVEQAPDNNLYINKYGELSIRFDFDDQLLMPGDFTVEVYDPDFYYDKMFDENRSTWNLRMRIDVFINAGLVFIGYAYEDDVSYDKATKLFKARFSSPLDELNKQYLDNQETGAALDPIGYGAGTNWILLSTILTDIFQFAESDYSSITTHLLNRCIWHPDNIPTWTAGIALLQLNTGYLFNPGTAFFNSATLGSMLKEIAFDFGSYAGVWGGQPFFIQLWEAHSGNSQTLTGLELMSKGYAYQTLEYVKVSSTSTCGANPFSLGNIGKSGIGGKKLTVDTPWYFCFSGGSNMKASGLGNVHRMRDLVIGVGYYQAQYDWIAIFNWQYRGTGSGFNDDRFQRRDIFRYPRINAVPTKHFTFDSRDYFITELSINFEDNFTRIAASIFQ